MNLQVTRRQHYVPRFYMRPWEQNGQVSALYQQNKMMLVSVEKILCENFFYDITSITSEDLFFCYMIMVYPQKNPGVKSMLEKVIEGYHLFAFLKTYTQVDRMADDVKKIGKMFIEGTYRDFEGKAASALRRLTAGDIHFLNQRDDLDFFAINDFMSLQHFRTKIVRDGMIRKINNDVQIPFHISEACGNLLGLLGGIAFACNMQIAATIGEAKFYLVKNQSCIDFITSDHPVVNLKADVSSEKPPVESELYCPISPRLALVVSDDLNYPTAFDENQVRYVNQRIVDFHDEWLIGNGCEMYRKVNYSGKVV